MRSGLVGVCLLMLAGCGGQGPSWRTYEEIVTDAPSTAVAHTHSAEPEKPAGPLRWTAPEGWIESAGSGMRLATFTVSRDGEEGVCTIVVLGVAAGVLDANVRRWIGQLDFEEPPPEELAAYLDRQERFRSEGGFDGVLVDLTEWRAQAAEADSMLGALIAAPHASIFLKCTGSVRLLRAVRTEFADLCRSIRIEE